MKVKTQPNIKNGTQKRVVLLERFVFFPTIRGLVIDPLFLTGLPNRSFLGVFGNSFSWSCNCLCDLARTLKYCPVF